MPVQTDNSGDREDRYWINNGQVGLEWNLSPRTTFGSLVTLQHMRIPQLAHIRSLTLEGSSLTRRTLVRDDELNDTWTYTANVNLRRKLANNQEVSGELDFVRFFNTNPHRYRFDSEFPAENRRQVEYLSSEKRTPLTLWVGRGDYSRNLGKKGKLETGLKGTFAHFENNLRFERQPEGGAWQLDPRFSQHVRMNERILAAYVSLRQEFNASTRLQAGLRYEHTTTDLRSVAGQELVNRRYGNLFRPCRSSGIFPKRAASRPRTAAAFSGRRSAN